ncbi:restriction endonuclease subunit S [Ligilactobacillus salivarius]|uniref:restriction endonuclease subunit S n=1 Tax=Ligilactobacillus salivarius TaxID=1624 RepID=UPI001CBD8DA3|nr:restriction endonuclease subunit S [Ligilactobacillus salivarius]MBZ4032390.1 restriction endonuclease subunit S [Ligilactobacillus salivarius]
MDNKKNGIPKLRFPGFTGAWEQRKFSEFATYSGKRNKDNLDLEPYAITSDNGFVRQSEAHNEFGYMKNTDRAAYKIVQSNSFGYNPARINIGSIGYYSGDKNIIVSSLYEVFKTNQDVNDEFLWIWFKSNRFQKWINKLQEGSVRLYFYYDKLRETKIQLPNLEEQRQVADLFTNLDSLIALHQRKLEHLQEQKKGLLQKMFPKNGETVPEVRFPGFTDAWEQRKLGETSKITAGGDVDKEKLLTHGKYPVIANALTNDGIVGYYNDAYRITAPAVTVTGRGEIGKAKSRKINFTPVVRLLSVESKHNVDFLAEAINRSKVVFESTGVPQLTVPKLSNYKISFPVSENEETKIGDFIQQFDSLIALHQRKLDHLELMKKGLLQQMFV